jgi:hypothetical protein
MKSVYRTRENKNLKINMQNPSVDPKDFMSLFVGFCDLVVYD